MPFPLLGDRPNNRLRNAKVDCVPLKLNPVSRAGNWSNAVVEPVDDAQVKWGCRGALGLYLAAGHCRLNRGELGRFKPSSGLHEFQKQAAGTCCRRRSRNIRLRMGRVEGLRTKRPAGQIRTQGSSRADPDGHHFGLSNRPAARQRKSPLPATFGNGEG